VWWSPEPAVLNLEAEAPLGLRRDDLIVKDVAPEIRARYEREYIAWRNGRIDAVAAANQPSIRVITATQAAAGSEELPGDNIDVIVEHIEDGEERPRGARFGTLVHALIADVPLEPSESGVLDRLASAHGRVLGATRDEIQAASAVVGRVLQHPLCIRAARASQSGRCYREIPITLRLASGVLIEGTVDLAFHENEEITVIDFKTDRELEGDLPVYRRQVQIYAHALATATGRPARGVLMKI